MMASISNLEIFGAGTHNAQTGKVIITEQDLDGIVEAFNALSGSNLVRPHLKLGHTDAQKWFGQKDGIPALGWIEKVWRVGSKLLANVKDVPSALIDLISQGRYHNVSAEVYMDAEIEYEGKKFNRVLSAVSLLGVEMPAVKDLAGLASALFQTGPIHQFSASKPTDMEKEAIGMFTQEQVESLVNAAVTKAVDEATQKFSAEVDDLKAKLEVSDKSREASAKELDAVKASAAQAEAKALVDGAIKDGKLLPKQREFALAFLGQKDNKLKFGDGEKSSAALFKDFLEAQGTVSDLTEKGSGKNKKVEFSNAADEVDVKAKELLSADTTGKLTYQGAFNKVLTLDSDLKQRWAEMSN
jgi:hypothetical protein